MLFRSGMISAFLALAFAIAAGLIPAAAQSRDDALADAVELLIRRSAADGGVAGTIQVLALVWKREDALSRSEASAIYDRRIGPLLSRSQDIQLKRPEDMAVGYEELWQHVRPQGQEIRRFWDAQKINVVLWISASKGANGCVHFHVVTFSAQKLNSRQGPVQDLPCTPAAGPVGQPPPHQPELPAAGETFCILGYAMNRDRGYCGRLVARGGGRITVEIVSPQHFLLNMGIVSDVCSNLQDVRTLRPGQRITIPETCLARAQRH